MADEKEKAVTTKSVMSEAEKGKTKAAQAAYKGNSHFDLVEVTIVKANEYYKAGEKDKVHPTTAALFEQKGLIAPGWENKVVERSSAENLLTEIQTQEVLDGDRDIDLPASKKTPLAK